MLASISTFICLQIYFVSGDKYERACAKSVEAALTTYHVDQDLNQARSAIEDKAKQKVSPTLAMAPLSLYQIGVQKQLTAHIPHTPLGVQANQHRGQITLNIGF